MNKFLGLLALVVTLEACTPANALDKPTRPSVDLKAESALGDSLTYVVKWGAAARADQYEVTVTAAIPAGWTGLPTNSRTTALQLTFTAINTSGWATAAFTAKVCSVVGGVTTLKCSTATWTKVRSPEAPGPVTIDSTGAVGIFLKPDSVTVVAGAQVQFCTFALAADGKVYGVNYADGTNTTNYPACTAGYVGWFPAAQRVSPLTVAVIYHDVPFLSSPHIQVLAAR